MSIDLFALAKVLFAGASVSAVIAAIVGYALAAYFGRRLDRIEKSAEEIRTTSLGLKKDMRSEERSELVAFRVAVEKWENFLQTMVFDFSMAPPDKADVVKFYKKDKNLFLEVKIAVVKVGIYLRNPDLEQQLMSTVMKVRQIYYPLISMTIPKLIDLQAELAPIEIKRKHFADSGMKDMAFAPTIEERDKSAALQAALTEEMRAFSAQLLAKYREVAGQLVDLKNAVNKYIYRPVTHAALDAD